MNKEEKMKKAAEEACERIRKEASQKVTDSIVNKVQNMTLDEDIHYAEFVKLNFEMMKELGNIGVVLNGVSPNNQDKSKVIYNATLPFNFEIVDDSGEVYTHFKVAQKAKCDVAVCSISNTNKIKSRFPFRRTKVVIELCDIISYDDVSKMTTIEIGEMSKELISKSIKKNREEYKFLNEK